MNESEQMDDVKATTQKATSNVKESVKSAAGAISDKAADVAGKAAEAVSNAKTYARDQYDQLGGKARDAYQSARETGRTWVNETEGYIHQRPLTSLAIAAGVGFLVGMFVKRK